MADSPQGAPAAGPAAPAPAPMGRALSAPPPTDPLATAKANLRDTIKWLATTLAGGAAVVLAGTSLSGLSNLHGASLIFAALGAVIGFVCVFAVVARLLKLLTGEAFYFSDLKDEANAEAVARINDHAIDLLSPTIPSVDELLRLRDHHVERIRALWKDGQSQSDEYKTSRDFLHALVDTMARVTYFAQFEVLRQRLRDSGWYLLFLSVIAVIGLGLFAVEAGSAKDSGSKSPSTITNLNYLTPPPAPARPPNILVNGGDQVLVGEVLSAAVEKGAHKDSRLGITVFSPGPVLDLLHSLVSAGLVTKDAAESLAHELTSAAIDATKEVAVDVAKKGIDKLFPSPDENGRAPININVSSCCGGCQVPRSSGSAPKPKTVNKEKHPKQGCPIDIKSPMPE